MKKLIALAVCLVLGSFALVIGLMIFATFNDVSRLF